MPTSSSLLPSSFDYGAFLYYLQAHLAAVSGNSKMATGASSSSTSLETNLRAPGTCYWRTSAAAAASSAGVRSGDDRNDGNNSNNNQPSCVFVEATFEFDETTKTDKNNNDDGPMSLQFGVLIQIPNNNHTSDFFLCRLPFSSNDLGQHFGPNALVPIDWATTEPLVLAQTVATALLQLQPQQVEIVVVDDGGQDDDDTTTNKSRTTLSVQIPMFYMDFEQTQPLTFTTTIGNDNNNNNNNNSPLSHKLPPMVVATLRHNIVLHQEYIQQQQQQQQGSPKKGKHHKPPSPVKFTPGFSLVPPDQKQAMEATWRQYQADCRQRRQREQEQKQEQGIPPGESPLQQGRKPPPPHGPKDDAADPTNDNRAPTAPTAARVNHNHSPNHGNDNDDKDKNKKQNTDVDHKKDKTKKAAGPRKKKKPKLHHRARGAKPAGSRFVG